MSDVPDDPRARLSAEDLRTRLRDLRGWEGDRNAITRTYDFPEFLAGVDAVGDVARVAEELDHHPDIDIRWRSVTFTCSTHSAGGVTGLDLRLAAEILRIATEKGAT